MSAAAAISVDRLVVNRGERRVLDEITFDVASGEIVGLIGPNGAGKTTTLAVLSTLLAPDAGEIRVAGHDLRRAPHAVRRSIGRVPQETALYPTLTGRENAAFFARLVGASAADARHAAAAALEQVGLAARADERTGVYSGGMQRRLSLACGLLGSPPVLLLDEPTVGVDPQSFESIVAAIRAHARGGAALLLSTHHMEEAEHLCDRVVLIDRGRVVATGPPAHLIREAVPGLLIDVVTDEALPEPWLDGIAGARACAAQDTGSSGMARGRAARVALADVELAPRVLERAARERMVLDFRVHRPSLHDAFLELTGAAPRD
ncbi:MAG TPA: heme ABC exporter ATP-binding protein CcmA [Gammaproteobacteria bacterium]|nr:heme ABC exporter ATP-binding protein CcmA [Gammaproteobacteria bacterium]